MDDFLTNEIIDMLAYSISSIEDEYAMTFVNTDANIRAHIYKHNKEYCLVIKTPSYIELYIELYIDKLGIYKKINALDKIYINKEINTDSIFNFSFNNTALYYFIIQSFTNKNIKTLDIDFD